LRDDDRDSDDGIGDGASERSRLPLRARSVSAKEQVRDALIAAGRQLFATMDFPDVSLRQIAKQAGYTAGVVYKYFPDRNSLFGAIRDAELRPYSEQLARAARDHEDPEERILAMTRLATVFSQSSAKNFGARFIYSTNAEPQSQPHGVDTSAVSQDIYRLHYDAADAFLAALPKRPIDSHSATLSMIAAVSGMATLPGTVKDGPVKNRTELTEMMVRSLLQYWAQQGRAE
jgi:AcrR family transcriptional regulator